jgi:hypothetical protein
MEIKVRANRHVMGLRRGEVGWVEDNKKARSLIRVGYLSLIQDYELPEIISAGFNDEPLPEIPEEAYGPDSVKLVDYQPEYFREFDDEADAYFLEMAQSRLDDDGNRIPFDEALEMFGITREELEAYTDPDES